MQITKVGLISREGEGITDRHAELTEFLISIGMEPPAKYEYHTELLCTPDQLAALLCKYEWGYAAGVVNIHEVKPAFKLSDQVTEKLVRAVGELDDAMTRLNVAAARLEAQDAACIADKVDCQPGWNAKVQAPLSGPVLHSFNELMLCEDYCTDALQSLLNEGWRMVAVCPQESRRPDYVLGRVAQPVIPDRAQRG